MKKSHTCEWGAWKGLEAKDKEEVGERKGKEENYVIIFQLKFLKK